MGVAVGVDADSAVAVEFGDDAVGDGVAGGVVDGRGVWSCPAGVDGGVALLLGVDDGEVDGGCCCVGGDAAAVLDEIDPVYGIIPDDPAELDMGEMIGSSFSRMSQTVGELHVRGYFDVATTAANMIVQDDVRRTRMFGDCVDDATDDHTSCVAPFIDSFGLWTMRRPLADEEHDFFLNTIFANDGASYEATPAALSDLLVAFLISPNFIYRVETDGEEIADGLYDLGGYA